MAITNASYALAAILHTVNTFLVIHYVAEGQYSGMLGYAVIFRRLDNGEV